MSRVRTHFARAALVALLTCGSACACSSATTSAKDAVRDCGFSVTWNKHVYLGLIYVLRRPQTYDDVVKPKPGRKLGIGFVPQCPGDASGTSATVYAVPGVAPRLAVLATTADDRRPVLAIRKGSSIPRELLARP